VLEYDLKDPESVQAACAVLDALKPDAEAQASHFDPLGGNNALSIDGSSGQVRSRNTSDEAGLTDLTDSLSISSISNVTPGTYDAGIDDMSYEDKAALLEEMFAELRSFDIRHILKVHNGSFGTTVEDLLSQQYLRQEADSDGEKHVIPKGIDGFEASRGGSYSRKSKRKKRRDYGSSQFSSLVSSSLSEGSTSSVNRWQQADLDIEYISQRTGLLRQAVTSQYNTCGHSLRATLLAICDNEDHTNPLVMGDEPILEAHAVDLRAGFPEVTYARLLKLVYLTHPSTASARELAAAMVGEKETIVPQYAPIKHSSRPPSPDTSGERRIGGAILPIGGALPDLRERAFAQASVAYQKSRSSPLMGGAAAHYASVGHAANAALLREQSVMADRLVAAQSTGAFCDLHGVTVRDATRLAKLYLDRWWETRREWQSQGRVMGSPEFKIVVGRGVHSADGRGKLGPAVVKVLKNNGWRFEKGEGELTVKGKVRR